jgi:predicted HTH transcriptional regulator
MFFSLHLIESYGLGVRRAKTALQQNGSKPVEYLPDNDTDNYTNAIIYINEEYRAIHDKEIGNKINGGQLNLRNEPQNINNKVAKRKNEILKLITKDNSMSKEMMANILDVRFLQFGKKIKNCRNV